MDSDIVFTTVPTAYGLKTEGTYNCSFGLVRGTAEFRMTRKAKGAQPIERQAVSR